MPAKRLTERVSHAFRRRKPNSPALSDAVFLEDTFLANLGRPIDIVGRTHYLAALGAGMRRHDVIEAIKASDEYQQRLALSARELPNLFVEAPERYVRLTTDDGEEFATYHAADESDFDWIESRILDDGYYEQPGIWSFTIDLDKQLMAEIIGLLEPRLALEVGCSSGAVLHCLHEAGIDVHGIDISALARSRAPDSIRDRIVLGDLTTMEHDAPVDVAFGLDVFEHLHPHNLDAFIRALVARVSSDGFVFVNVPAFGNDPVFGEVFTMFLPTWREDARCGRIFRHLQVDADGYPSHGHLIWATTEWWVDRFESAGLTRLVEVERAIHDIYDWYLAKSSPARRSFYVFAKQREDEQLRQLVARISSRKSEVLSEMRALFEQQGVPTR